MNCESIDILDLPDEILLMIMKKLDSSHVLYSLLNSNQRLDQMARSIDNTKFVDLSIVLANEQLSSVDNVKLDRFCNEILPQIHQNVFELTLDLLHMQRILLACEYSNLCVLNLSAFLPDMLSNYLKEESPVARLFGEKIRLLTAKSRQEVFTSQSFTDACVSIFAICKKLSYLNMNEWITCKKAQLSISDRPSNVCFSSQLLTLSIKVLIFEDCLCLLDGRLEQLSSFTVNISYIRRSTMVDDNQKVLSNLKKFSLTSNLYTNAYDCRILSLLRRMPNLNSLTLCLEVIRLTIIDGIHLNEEVLSTMSHLHTFIFHIWTASRTSEANYLSTSDIENTFLDWKYSSVGCCVDHFSNGHTYCHIYSKPFQMTSFTYLTNSFRGHNLQFVTYLSLYDTRSFENHFFQWISEAIPLLKHLIVHNFIPQEKKCQIGAVDDKQISSRIPYLHLLRLGLTYAHIDYANQFLWHTNAYLPALDTLFIQYEKLVTVTNNFTNDATRLNCGQLKQVKFRELLACPEHFHHYFPSLTD